jgi:hypothetical protein
MIRFLPMLLLLVGACDAGGPEPCVDSNGDEHAFGASWSESCNTCSCGEDGVVSCTEMGCDTASG